MTEYSVGVCRRKESMIQKTIVYLFFSSFWRSHTAAQRSTTDFVFYLEWKTFYFDLIDQWKSLLPSLDFQQVIRMQVRSWPFCSVFFLNRSQIQLTMCYEGSKTDGCWKRIIQIFTWKIFPSRHRIREIEMGERKKREKKSARRSILVVYKQHGILFLIGLYRSIFGREYVKQCATEKSTQ